MATEIWGGWVISCTLNDGFPEDVLKEFIRSPPLTLSCSTRGNSESELITMASIYGGLPMVQTVFYILIFHHSLRNLKL